MGYPFIYHLLKSDFIYPSRIELKFRRSILHIVLVKICLTQILEFVQPKKLGTDNNFSSEF